MSFVSTQRFVIWGLLSSNHTHRHIHSGFFEAGLQLGFETIWLSDSIESKNKVRAGDLVFASNMASRFLPIANDARYVLHNLNPSQLGLAPEACLKLQVYTKAAAGDSLGIPRVNFDSGSRTLYQPWGVPTAQSSWLPPRSETSAHERWIGSVWNNRQNQGNAEVIKQYSKALRTCGFTFSQAKGRPAISNRFPWIVRDSISELDALATTNENPVSAAIVGSWQKVVGYAPCRLFKSVAAGQPAVSNSDFSDLFPGGIFEQDVRKLVQLRKGLSLDDRQELVQFHQKCLRNYTYTENLRRIISLLET